MENSMSGKRRNKPEWYALGVLVISTLVLLFCSACTGVIYSLVPSLGERTPYLMQLFVDFFGFIYVCFLIRRLGYRNIFEEHRVGLLHGCIVGGYFLVGGGLSILSQLSGLQGIGVQPIEDILIFVLTMLFIGLTEEFLCRGVIVNLLMEHYGRSAVGVKYSVLISGILFGLFHLSNAIGGVIEFTGVLVQVLITSAMGMLFTAIYLRTKNIWVVVLLHAFNDFAALLSSGVFYQGTLQAVISSYSANNLVVLIPFLVTTCFLLRRSKMNEILEITENSKTRASKGNIECKGYVESKGNIESKRNLEAKGNIGFKRYIEAKGNNESKENNESKGNIESKENSKSIENTEYKEYVEYSKIDKTKETTVETSLDTLEANDESQQFLLKIRTKFHKALIGYGVSIGVIAFLLVIQNPFLSVGVITSGSGYYYGMDAISTVEIPYSGSYKFLISVEDAGFPVVVDVVITDSNQNVIASKLDTYSNNEFILELDQGSYTISAYIIGDQQTLQEHLELGLYSYDDEEIAQLMQTLPKEQPESYGAKITKKVTLK